MIGSPASAKRDLIAAGFDEIRTEGRLLAPLRIAYKLSEGFGGWLASKMEPLDDRLHRSAVLKPFAGHLIAIGRVPAGGKARAPR